MGGTLQIFQVVENSGHIAVEAGSTLLLTGATINGTAGSVFGNAGVIEIAELVTFDGDVVTNSAGVLQVDSGATLALTDSTIDGGTIDNQAVVDIVGSSTIDDGAILDGGQFTIESGQTLTFGDVTLHKTQISGGTIDNGSRTSGATITVSGRSKIEDAKSITARSRSMPVRL